MTPESVSERAARLSSRLAAEAEARRRDARYSRSARVERDLRSGAAFAYQVTAALWWLWQRVGRPVGRLARRPASWLYRRYRRLWFYCVYRRDEERVLVFSKTRAGLFLAASVLFVLFVLPSLVELVWDASLYAVTAHRHERVFLLGSQEIDSTTGAHVVEGCSRLPCADDDAIYFRTEGGLFNNLWSLAHGKGLFYPEYVGAAVPYSTSRCVITSYGVRVRFPFRLVNVYSHLLAVSCEPLDRNAR